MTIELEPCRICGFQPSFYDAHRVLDESGNVKHVLECPHCHAHTRPRTFVLEACRDWDEGTVVV